jgi:hypothetical protein
MNKIKIKSYLKLIAIFLIINSIIYLTTLILIITINILNGRNPLDIPNGFLLNIPYLKLI